MIKSKSVKIALVAICLLSTQAQASDAMVESSKLVPNAGFNQTDINSMFEQPGRSMQLAKLSGQEMKETEGAFLNFAIGAVVGVGGYVLIASATDTPMTWQGAGFSAGVGALTSGLGGALIGASGGGIAGNVAWRPAMLATNFGAAQLRKARGW
ncbi:hypothetical protein [Massilia eurypsychrophila]|jgi:hypothetical protein|nr:hypothetical protein [Massilia eurypsychrophila]